MSPVVVQPMPATPYYSQSASSRSAAPSRARSRAAPRVPSTRVPALTAGGLLAAALAALPLAGWGAGWPALASYVTGWPLVSPYTTVALLGAAVALVLVGTGARRGVRRTATAAAGALLLAVAVVAVSVPRLPSSVDLLELVTRWPEQPALLLRVLPDPFTAGGLAFLGCALLLLAVGSTAAVRGVWLTAAGAALVALLTAGPTAVERTGPDPLLPEVVLPMPPAVALVVLVLASALLLVRAPSGAWWIAGPSRGAGAQLGRLMVPGLLMVPAALVWSLDLLRRQRVLGDDAMLPLLATAIVVTLGALLATALRGLAHSDVAARERDERRLERRMRQESEQAAQQANLTLRAASERYRAHLRGILDVAPTPFLALDRDGYVAYANTASAELFACRPEEAIGHSVLEVWPELGAELRDAAASAARGGAVQCTLASESTGRRFEVRGYPDEAGAALFVRPIAR